MELKDIFKQMPEGYKKACWETKAMGRRRGIQNHGNSIYFSGVNRIFSRTVIFKAVLNIKLFKLLLC